MKREDILCFDAPKFFEIERQKKEYRPIPFWSWNDKLKLSNLTEQARWMNENGMGGFFMHARSGLQTEYLSEEWMQCIDACANEARRLDMKAWIYDEMSWIRNLHAEDIDLSVTQMTA